MEDPRKSALSITRIELKNKTKRRLLTFGKKGQSFDLLINEILDHVDSCDRWWEDRFD